MGKPEVTMMSLDDFRALVEAKGDDCFICFVGHFDLGAIREHSLGVPVVKDLDAEILKAVEAGGTLDMSDWHGDMYPKLTGDERLRAEICGTTHCRAGWAIHLAGEAGIALESAVGAESAGACIYLASTGSIPDFFATNDEAMEDMRRCAGRAG